MEEQTTLDEMEFEETENDDSSMDETIERRKIYTDKGDPEIESLYGKYKRGRLNIQPDFQRHYVWDIIKASRLIESTFLEIPIPVIYLSEAEDGIEEVIDGQQRLASFFSYIDGKLPDQKAFKLSGLNVFTEYNGKLYRNLDDKIQDKIRYTKIHTITFKKESDHDLKFEVFERLNTGAVSLNPQELRNCVYRGKFNDLLKELSANNEFLLLLGLKAPHKRMKEVELVLRFAAFYFNTYLNYKPSMKNFLNKTMNSYKNISDDDAERLTKAFKNSIEIIYSLLGKKNAFKRYHKGTENDIDGHWEQKKFNVSLYDILMYSFAREDKNTVYRHLDSIREALINLMTDDQEFIESIELSTSSIKAVTKRFDKWRLTLQEIIGIHQREQRCFSYELKKQLFKNNNVCSICGNIIQDIDDAAVDHIDQYWTGGKTIPENARLTHRYCNWSRSRND